MEEGHTHHRRALSRAHNGLADAAALIKLGINYWLKLQLQVRRELAEWEAYAHEIPDPLLRQHALEKLTGERLNPEAAALFAVLAARQERSRVVTLIVAYQVLYDYLDGVNEQPGFDELHHGLQLHRALTEAVLPEIPLSDYYLHHPGHDDGGYLLALTTTCRETVQSIPSLLASAPVLRTATERCAQAQSHNHATCEWDHSRLIDWSAAQAEGQPDYLWWELAAGGISCLAIHALLACAANPNTHPEEPALIDRAYFPPVCAISALLDSLADYERDAGTTNHSFVAHYRDDTHAAERLRAITEEADSLLAPLRHHRRHSIILAGIVAYYLSSPSVLTGFPVKSAESLMGCIGSIGALMRTVMSARRRLHQRTTNAAQISPHERSRNASPGSTLEAMKPGPANTTRAAPTIAASVSIPLGNAAENTTGKPVTARR